MKAKNANDRMTLLCPMGEKNVQRFAPAFNSQKAFEVNAELSQGQVAIQRVPYGFVRSGLN